MLKAHFNKITITKPNTSRPCNSEKYIVCEEFLGVSKDYLNRCFISIDLWSKISRNKYHIHSKK